MPDEVTATTPSEDKALLKEFQSVVQDLEMLLNAAGALSFSDRLDPNRDLTLKQCLEIALGNVSAYSDELCRQNFVSIETVRQNARLVRETLNVPYYKGG